MGYRTTPGRPTGNTPFALTYGMDAVIPTEIGLPTIRTDAAKQKDANTELGRNLELGRRSQRKRIHPDGRLSTKSIAHYNRKVRPRNFKKWEQVSHGASFLHLEELKEYLAYTVLLHAAAIPKDKFAAASLPSVSFHSKLLSGVDSIHPLAGLPHPTAS
ncbi:hypothetical protein CK203_010850 [Vitis vinifera]|uniref:Uncharacterized protein n=1 Tax=Vitis vinifera TaxID=29760 RepID=A0A438JIJ1_VITVI|nr:hypothetical protein CK203_010850 [Vitis vinifera]